MPAVPGEGCYEEERLRLGAAQKGPWEKQDHILLAEENSEDALLSTSLYNARAFPAQSMSSPQVSKLSVTSKGKVYAPTETHILFRRLLFSPCDYLCSTGSTCCVGFELICHSTRSPLPFWPASKSPANDASRANWGPTAMRLSQRISTSLSKWRSGFVTGGCSLKTHPSHFNWRRRNRAVFPT